MKHCERIAHRSLCNAMVRWQDMVMLPPAITVIYRISARLPELVRSRWQPAGLP